MQFCYKNFFPYAKKYRIGTIKNDVVETFLLETKFTMIDGVGSMEQNFEKLKQGRIDLIAHTETTFREFIKNHHYDQKSFSVVYVLSESPNYYAFGKDVSDETIRRFQNAFDGLHKERNDILANYGLTR